MALALGRYFFLGLGLSFTGTATAVISYFEAHLIPFSALGIAIVIVGLTAVSLPDNVNASNAMKALLQGSTLGIDPLLDEIVLRRSEQIVSQPVTMKPIDDTDWRSSLEDAETEEIMDEREVPAVRDLSLKSVYLPPDLSSSVGDGQHDAFYEGKASVYVPLIKRPTPTSFEEMRHAPVNLQMGGAFPGVRVFTAGACLGQVTEIKGEDKSVEDALQFVLVEFAELCSLVRATEIEDTVVVEINDVKVKPESKNYRDVLGSFPTSLCATIVSIVREAPVVITDEEIAPAKTIARLSILRLKREEGSIVP